MSWTAATSNNRSQHESRNRSRAKRRPPFGGPWVGSTSAPLHLLANAGAKRAALLAFACLGSRADGLTARHVTSAASGPCDSPCVQSFCGRSDSSSYVPFDSPGLSTFGFSLNKISIRASVPLCNRYAVLHTSIYGTVAFTLRCLWGRMDCRLSTSDGDKQELSTMPRSPLQGRCQHSTAYLHLVVACAPSMYRQERQGLSTLRWAWYYHVRPVAREFRCFRARHGTAPSR